MTIQTKTIGRMPTDHGPYDPELAYGKKFQCELFGCAWESLHDNNNTAPAVWDGGDTITPNLVDWKKVSGDYNAWLMNRDKPAQSVDYPFNGMGRVKLQKHIVDGHNFLYQDDFYKGEVGSRVPNTNTIFEVRYAFELAEDITIPAGCVLKFEGGSIKNGGFVVSNATVDILKGDFQNITFSLSNSKLKLYNCNIVTTSHVDNVIYGERSSVEINHCRFSCVADNGIYINNENYDEELDVIVKDCEITGTYNYAVRAIAAYSGVIRNKGYGIIENTRINLTSGHPYHFSYFKDVTATGGEFSSDGNGSCNIYSCESSKINGGYYHDLSRGATIGGKIGKIGSIVGTVNKNIANMGVSVDLAKGTTPETYEVGNIEVIGNTVVNARIGIYIQAINAIISGNSVVEGDLTDSTGGIRVNTNTQTDTILVSGNLIDYSGHQWKCISINGGAVRVNNNVCLSGLAENIGGESSGRGTIHSGETIHVTENNQRVPVTAKFIIIDDGIEVSSSYINLRFAHTNTDGYIGETTIISNHQSKGFEISGQSGHGMSFVGSTINSAGSITKIVWKSGTSGVCYNVYNPNT